MGATRKEEGASGYQEKSHAMGLKAGRAAAQAEAGPLTSYKDMFNSLGMDDVQTVFAALADPTRLKIMHLIRDMEMAMGELADVLGQSQPRVSRHVRILAEAGLVHRHKEGAWVFVAPHAEMPREVYDLLDRLLQGRDPCGVERLRIGEVRSERQKAVDQWFHANADEWDLIRRLEGSGDALEDAILGSADDVGRLLDIGTGTGRMIELLGPRATSATGVDRSPEMLRVARAKLPPATEIRQADMRALPYADNSFETVVMHHVLHFADDPAAIVAEASRVVARPGRLLVVDYAAHAHEELRARFQHVRLGFDEASISGWMSACGLEPRVVTAETGPALTSILWEGTRQ